MKTPKEKALELVEIMSNQTYSYQPYAGAHYSTDEIGLEAGVKCALIAVENELRSIMWLSLLCTFDNYMKAHFELKIQELKEVKEELENL